MSKLKSDNAWTEEETPLGAFCSEVKSPREYEQGFETIVQPFDEDKWLREAKARSLFNQYLQHDVTLKK